MLHLVLCKVDIALHDLLALVILIKLTTQRNYNDGMQLLIALHQGELHAPLPVRGFSIALGPASVYNLLLSLGAILGGRHPLAYQILCS